VLKDLPVNTDQRAEIYLSWATLKSYNEWLASDKSWGGISSELQCFARLRPNVSAAQVEKLLPAYVTKYRPKSKNIHVYKLQPLADVHFDARYGGPMEKRNLWILSFIGLFLVATACVNFVNLATAQALRRSKEVGIRKVLGGLRWQLFWQFMAETGIIAVAATVVATGISFLLLPYVNEWFHVQLSINFFRDGLLLLFVIGLLSVVTLLAGAYPGLILSGFRPVTALKGKLSMQQIGGFNTRRVLIVTQFTISLVLIIGMLVITRQMQYAQEANLGFNKDAIVMIPLGGDTAGIKTKTLQNRLANIPGVQKVSQCYSAPSSDENWNSSIRFDTRTEDELFRVSIKSADDQYLPTFDLQLAAGRNIFPSDSVREFLVNETMVRKLNLSSPGEAIGKKIRFNGNMSGAIVGVLKDFHDRSLHEDINAVAVTTYLEGYGQYAVKINMRNAASVLPALEKTWSGAYPEKIYEYQFLDEGIAAFYETEQTMLKIIRAFSFIAIFIGCLGLYGLVAFMVAQKTKEIGIRKVLGSGVTEICWMFGKEFARLILLAFLVAAPVAGWLMNSWLKDFKYHISIGPWIFVLAIAISFAVAALTVGYQSIRAALLSPVKSLRTE
jgi:ABC-type antimicrobial peptide transport system permease subunit